MHSVLSQLKEITFPELRRDGLDTLQVNLGYRCNLACLHCHVSAGPYRTEQMSRDTARVVLRFLEQPNIKTLDLTGGAPEMNPHFKELVSSARALGKRVIDRCNLTILNEPNYENLEFFLAEQQVEIVASLPCYLEENVDHQRGRGVYDDSIRALKRLNSLGYGRDDTGLTLNLVYNPQGPTLPPPQVELEADYKTYLREQHDVVFNHLFTLANLPIGRFGSSLVSHKQFDAYVDRLQQAHQSENLSSVMCRTLISVDWEGYVYDCDFNQMLGIPINGKKTHLSELMGHKVAGQSISTAGHCFGCTAGQGSSCGGALR